MGGSPDTGDSPEIIITSHPYTGRIQPDANYKPDFMTRYRAGRVLMQAVLKSTCGFRVEGAENIPAQGPAILACNHQSLADPPFIAVAIPQRQVYFIAKKELRTMPVIGWVVRGCGCVWVDRRARDGKALQGALEVLRQNRLLGIFPEGTRSKSGKLLPAHSGVATLALHTGAPVIPAAVFNTLDILQSRWPWGHQPLGVRFGQPICFEREETANRERIRIVKDEIMWRISQLMQQGMPQ
ncbi:MAG: lysophospholipid acyltransferase family protein [bacterium]|nr:lysophospholipid acyltransferase family protein [bacterium]